MVVKSFWKLGKFVLDFDWGLVDLFLQFFYLILNIYKQIDFHKSLFFVINLLFLLIISKNPG